MIIRGHAIRRALIVCACLVAAPILPTAAQSAADAEREWRRWVEDVRPFMTRGEEKAVKKLPTPARPAFLGEFWRRRGPAGGGPDVFRPEFEQRLLRADKRFRVEGGATWNDCGRTYMLLGKPDFVKNVVSESHFATDDRLAAFREEPDRLAEMWTYKNPPKLPASPEGYVFRFTQTCDAVGGATVQRLLQQVAESYLNPAAR
ncbi:MAG TPA: GWxTD domain-containing protein [Vicinamibacterales bacterium]|jgi:GWxTD domain-containing protein